MNQKKSLKAMQNRIAQLQKEVKNLTEALALSQERERFNTQVLNDVSHQNTHLFSTLNNAVGCLKRITQKTMY